MSGKRAYELVNFVTGPIDEDTDGTELIQQAESLKPKRVWTKLATRSTAVIVVTVVVLAGLLTGLAVLVHIKRAINYGFDSIEVLEANGTQPLLLVEQQYSPLDPEALYFEQDSGFDHTVFLYFVPDASQPDTRTFLLKFMEDSNDYGGMQDGQVYYISRLHRATCMYHGVPAIMYLPSIPDAIEITRTWRSVITKTTLPEDRTGSTARGRSGAKARLGNLCRFSLSRGNTRHADVGRNPQESTTCSPTAIASRLRSSTAIRLCPRRRCAWRRRW